MEDGHDVSCRYKRAEQMPRCARHDRVFGTAGAPVHWDSWSAGSSNVDLHVRSGCDQELVFGELRRWFGSVEVAGGIEKLGSEGPGIGLEGEVLLKVLGAEGVVSGSDGHAAAPTGGVEVTALAGA